MGGGGGCKIWNCKMQTLFSPISDRTRLVVVRIACIQMLFDNREAAAQKQMQRACIRIGADRTWLLSWYAELSCWSNTTILTLKAITLAQPTNFKRGLVDLFNNPLLSGGVLSPICKVLVHPYDWPRVCGNFGSPRFMGLPFSPLCLALCTTFSPLYAVFPSLVCPSTITFSLLYPVSLSPLRCPDL